MGLTENLTLLRAGEREALAGTGDGHISKPPLLLHGCRVAHGVHMGEQGLLHASHPNAVELKALGGVHGHKGDGLTVLGHRIQVGAQANPFQKIGQRIAAQHAHRLDDSSSPTVGAAKSDSSASWVCTNSSTTPRNS